MCARVRSHGHIHDAFISFKPCIKSGHIRADHVLMPGLKGVNVYLFGLAKTLPFFSTLFPANVATSLGVLRFCGTATTPQSFFPFLVLHHCPALSCFDSDRKQARD